MAVLVDSSVWIDAAKARSSAKTRLSSLISKNSDIICVTELVQVEVCQGARTQGEFQALWDAFLGFKMLPIRSHHWELAAWSYFRCRKQGITVSTMDCLIATIAASYRVPLWTLDSDFKKMQVVIGFDFY